VNYKSTLKSSVAAAALFAIAAPVAPSVNAADDTLKSGNKNSMTISGYVARALWYADDGRSDSVFNSDGSTSTSRIRWVASGTMNENVTAGSMVELAFPRSNNQALLGLSGTGSTSIGRSDGPEFADSAWGIRHTFVWVNHKKMGKISLGQTNSASNGRAETSFSGTTMADLSSGTPLGDGIRFISTDNATTSVSTVTVGAAFTNFDGRSRTDVLRYDTPRFAGLSLATSYIAGGDWDIGADYQAKTGAVRVRVQAQYNNAEAGQSVGDTTITSSDWAVSAAALHDGGLNASAGFGKRDLGGDGNAGRSNPHFFNVTLGYRAKIFSAGGTNFSFNWNHTEDLAADNSEGDAIGFTVAQIFNSIGANMAFIYRNYSYDTSTSTFDDVDIFGLQTVFNF